MQEKYFHGYEDIDDVTGWPQSRLSISFIDEKLARFVFSYLKWLIYIHWENNRTTKF